MFLWGFFSAYFFQVIGNMKINVYIFTFLLPIKSKNIELLGEKRRDKKEMSTKNNLAFAQYMQQIYQCVQT